MTSKLTTTLAALAMTGTAAVLAPAAGAACRASEPTAVPQPTSAQMRAAGLNRLPVGPLGRRLDLVAPRFSNPTSVTNPLFPISKLQSVVLNGHVEGKAFRTETTLLPETRVIEWSPGQCVSTLVSQYFAYLDGRIEEVALDFYAQADDGSVWYFGEEVNNYGDGVIADTSGTWLAGKEGPAAMIMPGAPRPGDVHRPENIPGLVWEEVTAKAVGRTVRGPLGPVSGALVGRELHDHGSFSDKIFVPGYGEFFSAHSGDLEALAVAAPIDAANGPEPVALRRLAAGAKVVFDRAGTGRWGAASVAMKALHASWRALPRTGVPVRLIAPTNRALGAVERGVDARNRNRARNGALDVLQAALDLRLRHRPVAEIDRARLDLWLRQVAVDAAARDTAALAGDVATSEWIRDRIAPSLGPVTLTRVDTLLEELRAEQSDDELAAAVRTAAELRRVLAGAGAQR